MVCDAKKSDPFRAAVGARNSATPMFFFKPQWEFICGQFVASRSRWVAGRTERVSCTLHRPEGKGNDQSTTSKSGNERVALCRSTVSVVMRRLPFR